MTVIPFPPKPDPERRKRNIDAALREIDKLEREYPVLFQGRPPAGHCF